LAPGLGVGGWEGGRRRGVGQFVHGALLAVERDSDLMGGREGGKKGGKSGR